jgi:outer membrane protein assembly factor BamB
MRTTFQFSLIVLLATNVVHAAEPPNPYSTAAQRYADALLKYGRDHYGPVHTPLFAHMLDLRTLEVPKQRTAAEWLAEMSQWKEDRNYLIWGKDRSSVLWAQDSNLLWDTENIRLLYALSRESGDARFANAAEDYMRYFLKHCVSRTTGLFAWGEHIAYNIVDDEIHGQRHELQHPSPLWDELWRLDPDAVQNEIEGVYKYHITDRRTMAYDRHANFWNGLPERDQATILGYIATYIDSFAFLNQRTHNQKYNDWARKLVLAFQSKSDAAGLYPDNWTEQQARELPYAFIARPNIAIGLYSAYERTHDERWLDDANRYLEVCDRSFRSGSMKPMDRKPGEAALVQAALKGYEITGNAAYLETATRTGGEILAEEQPHAQMASTLAEKLNAIRRLYEVTGDQRWLNGARKMGDYALVAFIHPSGLIRGTAIIDRPAYYDAIQGPGALALALHDLGNIKGASTPSKPHAYDATPPPVIADIQFPKVGGNQERIAVSARITDPAGVKHASLHYAYGNEVGFTDSDPEVAGDRYTFHIPPPGLTFLGDVFFAVEATGAKRTLSGWNHLRTAAYEMKKPENGALRFVGVGLTVESVVVERPVRAQLSKVPPVGVSQPSQGWASTGRYLCFDGPVKGARITMSYAPEDTWRLIGSTLAVAYLSGTKWHRVPSKIDAKSGTVSAEYHAADCWTLVGEDRVLWRAPGRHGGVAMADFDGNGKYEVATVAWQPGQLLSSEGKPIGDYPVDPPYHPLQNPSSPIIATLRPGDSPLLLFGAPAGYVYAYDKSAKLRWRAEVGGEILGGVAVGRLTNGPELSVVATWNGGVGAIDSGGRTIWHKDLPTPSGSVPVLVDLDGDGKLDIVLTAGSQVIALKGDSGSALWSYNLPGAHFTTPTAGAFVRDGKPRVVTGDETGVVYALDETGKLLWRQTKIFGPREVPEWIDQYAPISELALADLNGTGERQVVLTTKGGDTVALTARGERLWHFASYERKVGTSLARGGHLAFADLDNDGALEVVVAQQDSFLYVLDAAGRVKWMYRGYFWYHNAPSIADLEGTGELDIVFTAPEDGGTYALRSGFKGPKGRAPWSMDRGTLARDNCAPWR